MNLLLCADMIHCNCSGEILEDPMNGEVDIMNTLTASWATYMCNPNYTLNDDYEHRRCINGSWTGPGPPTCCPQPDGDSLCYLATSSCSATK